LSAATIAENSGTNAVIGTLTMTDLDIGDKATFALVAGDGATDNGKFNISGSTLRASSSLDYEAKATHSIRVRVTDGGGLTYEKQFTISVTNVEDATPSVPTGLNATKVTGTSVSVSWSASSDDMAVTGYNVYRNGVYVATVGGTTTRYTFSGLSSITSYAFSVLAFDAAKKRSAQSASITVTTLDGTKPSAPTNVASSNVTKTGARVTWTASTDNVGVTFYNIYRNGTYIATVSGTKTSYNLVGLTAGTTYSITVRALDAAKNFTNSTALSVTTLP
jgi:chitodextrinase